MMKRERNKANLNVAAFVPALTPLEASVIPAKPPRITGALRMARDAFNPWRDERTKKQDQRAKICVR